MKSSKDQTGLAPDELRRLAENRVRPISSNVSKLPSKEIDRLVYELEVHQEELEIQNEELRRVQAELSASRERYADLYDFAPVGYLTLDTKGTILDSNLMAATMVGRERSRIIGSRLGQFCDPSSNVGLCDHLESVRTSQQKQSCELKFVTPEMTVVFIRLDSNPVAMNLNDDWQCRMILTDITQRKIAEQALMEKDKHLRSVTNALPVLIGYIDSDLKFQWANLAFTEWFGLKPSEIAGQRVQAVIGDESSGELADYLHDVLAGHRVDFETQLTHQKSGTRHVQWMLIPDIATDRIVKGVHGLGVDITERIVVEKQNARRRDYAERLIRLNASEREIYDLLICGKSNKAIASELDIGLRTAERRRKIILDKLNVESLAELLQQLAKSNE